MSGETFTCAACGRTFPKVLTDEEATAQTAEQVRGTPEDTATVCEPCYDRIVLRCELCDRMRSGGDTNAQTCVRTGDASCLEARTRQTFVAP